MTSISIKKRKVFLHKEFKTQIESEHSQFKKKADWLISQLILNGRPDKIKGTGNQPCRWRRSPIRGSQYYLWWVPLGSQGTDSLMSFRTEHDEDVFFIRKITLHKSIDRSETISLGSEEDYYDNEVFIWDLQPYEDEQAEIIHRPVQNFSIDCQIDIVRGAPGSGKTVALKFALRELFLKHTSDQKFIYITYTPALKADAEKFCKVYAIDENVDIYTLDNLIEHYLDDQDQPSLYKTMEESLDAFQNFLNSEAGQKILGEIGGLKQWKECIEDLWIEIRSYIIGVSIPDDWERGEKIISSDSKTKLIKPLSYGQLRDKERLEKILVEDDLRIAYRIAKSIKENKTYFQDIFPELFDLEKVLWKNIKPSDKKYVALIIDEIQDLTLSQITLIARIAKETQNQQLPYRILLAGDESQTIQPSGFDWKFTKNILRKYFDVNPQECPPLQEQKRSPFPLNLLIQKTKDLYQYLPKSIKPDQDSDNNKIIAGIKDQQGKLFLCKVSIENNYHPIIQELEKYSGLGLVVIDLENKIEHPFLTNYLAQIKGLEKEYVILANLDKYVKKLLSNYEKRQSNPVCLLESRRIIDNIRVAVSRSTNTLILLAENPEIIEQEFPSLPFVKEDWTQICRRLNAADQDIELIEKVNTLIGDWKNSIEREDIREATRLREKLRSDEWDINDYQISRNIEDLELDYQELKLKDQRNKLDKKIREQIKEKSIDNISDPELQNFNQELSQLIIQEEKFYGKAQEKTKELQFEIEYLLFFKNYGIKNNRIDRFISDRENLLERYKDLNKLLETQQRLNKKINSDLRKHHQKLAWNRAEQIRKEQAKRIKEWHNYIETVNIVAELSLDNKAKAKYIQIIHAWKSFYPIDNIKDVDQVNLKIKIVCDNQNNPELIDLQEYTTKCFTEDLLFKLNTIFENSFDSNFKKAILRSEIVIDFIRENIDSVSNKFVNSILLESREFLLVEEVINLYNNLGEKYPLQEAVTLLETLNRKMGQIRNSEIDYFVKEIKKLQSLVKKKNQEQQQIITEVVKSFRIK